MFSIPAPMLIHSNPTKWREWPEISENKARDLPTLPRFNLVFHLSKIPPVLVKNIPLTIVRITGF